MIYMISKKNEELGTSKAGTETTKISLLRTVMDIRHAVAEDSREGSLAISSR